MVDIPGVEFLKIEFRANYYIDTGSEDSSCWVGGILLLFEGGEIDA